MESQSDANERMLRSGDVGRKSRGRRSIEEDRNIIIGVEHALNRQFAGSIGLLEAFFQFFVFSILLLLSLNFFHAEAIKEMKRGRGNSGKRTLTGRTLHAPSRPAPSRCR